MTSIDVNRNQEIIREELIRTFPEGHDFWYEDIVFEPNLFNWSAADKMIPRIHLEDGFSPTELKEKMQLLQLAQDFLDNLYKEGKLA